LGQTVLHIISGLNDGGAEAVLYRLCQHGDPVRHHVISMGGEGKYGPLLDELGTRVDVLNMPRGRLTLRGLWRLFWLVRKSRADVVQTWMYHADLVGGAVARLAGKRRVFWGVHHTTLDAKNSSRSALFAARLSARFSRVVPSKIICCAEKSAEVHAELGYDTKPMVVIPNGYDLARFKPDLKAGKRLRHELELDEDTPLLGFVARYDPQKDHANLVAALGVLRCALPGFHCVLVGTGLDEGNATLAALVEKEGLSSRVTLLGRRNDIPAVMSALDIHVMSSAFGEAFPNVLAEAMACGTPCVSTDVGDAATIIGDTGWVVPPRNPSALAEAIATAFASRSEPGWSARCNAARARIEDCFSIERMVASYRAVWLGDLSQLPETTASNPCSTSKRTE